VAVARSAFAATPGGPEHAEIEPGSRL
jgi:hypothetical protein